MGGEYERGESEIEILRKRGRVQGESERGWEVR